MTRYSAQPRDWVFVKGYDFCLLLRVCVKVLVKI